MKQTLMVGVGGIAISAAMLALGFAYGGSSAPAGEPQVIAAPQEAALDRKSVETIVREYLLENPEIMLEVQTALQTKQEQEQRITQRETITNQSDAIFNAAYDGIVGNPDGKVTIVEFFDYNCGYCKRAMDDMDEMVKNDPDLRFVLKEFPILGPDSQKAHVVSMAFRSLHPEKYAEFHRELLNGPGRAGEEKAMRVATDLGADEQAIRAAMRNPEIEAAFGKTYELANALSITGTPSYVVGDEVVFGALGREVLSEKVANVKECQSTVC